MYVGWTMVNYCAVVGCVIARSDRDKAIAAQLYYTITGFDYVTTNPDGFVAVIVKYS